MFKGTGEEKRMLRQSEQSEAEQRCGDLRREAQASIERIRKYMGEMRANLELLGLGDGSGEGVPKQSDSSAAVP